MKRIANDLMSIVTSEDQEEDLELTDLLRKVLFLLSTGIMAPYNRDNSSNNSSSGGDGNMVMIGM